MDEREFHDDTGGPFWVAADFSDQERPVFRIRREHFPIGHVMIRAFYSTWRISDLVIERVVREQLWLGPIPWLPPKKHRNRDRGIGTKVMQMVIEEARKRSVRQITGDVVPELPDDAERLRHFYERLGFRIEPPEPHSMEGAVACFVMNLDDGRP